MPELENELLFNLSARSDVRRGKFQNSIYTDKILNLSKLIAVIYICIHIKQIIADNNEIDWYELHRRASALSYYSHFTSRLIELVADPNLLVARQVYVPESSAYTVNTSNDANPKSQVVLYL